MKDIALNTLRKKINKIDDKIISLLSERMNVVKSIGEEKAIIKHETLDTNRQKNVLKRWQNKAKKHNLSEDLIEKIYTFIHDHAVQLQKENHK